MMNLERHQKYWIIKMSLLDTLNEKKLNTNYIIESKSVVLDKILSGSVVFFTGAGFSKSWSQDYPLGFDLFSINNQEQRNIFEVANSLNIKKPEKLKNPQRIIKAYGKTIK